MITCTYRSPEMNTSVLWYPCQCLIAYWNFLLEVICGLFRSGRKVSAKDKDDHLDPCWNVSFYVQSEIKKKKMIPTPSQVVVDYPVTRTGAGKKKSTLFTLIICWDLILSIHYKFCRYWKLFLDLKDNLLNCNPWNLLLFFSYCSSYLKHLKEEKINKTVYVWLSDH